MFQSLKRVVYKVIDLEEAKLWYTKVLSKQPLFDSPFAVIFQINESSLSLSKITTPVPGIPGMTEIYWEVEDIDEAFQKLVESGAQIHTPVKEVMNIRIAKLIDPFGNMIGLSGTSNTINQRRVENKPSETAMGVTYCRALAAKDERDEIRGTDDLAELFLTEDAKKIISDKHSREWSIKNVVSSALYGYVICRTAFIDAVFERALSNGFKQIVILGAGYDSRTCRFMKMLKGAHVFELDIPSTQGYKIDMLEKAKVLIPPQLSFVSINFKCDNLRDVLSNKGYDENLKTLFIWEGVTYYLEKDTVIKTLEFIGEHAASGSLLCFDYLTEKIDSVNPAEPFLFWNLPGDMVSTLSGKGFEIIENINPQEMSRRYLTLNDGSTAEMVLPFFYLTTAKKK